MHDCCSADTSVRCYIRTQSDISDPVVRQKLWILNYTPRDRWYDTHLLRTEHLLNVSVFLHYVKTRIFIDRDRSHTSGGRCSENPVFRVHFASTHDDSFANDYWRLISHPKRIQFGLFSSTTLLAEGGVTEKSTCAPGILQERPGGRRHLLKQVSPPTSIARRRRLHGLPTRQNKRHKTRRKKLCCQFDSN